MSRLLELVQETRDAGIRTEEHIKQINEKLADGATRLDDHSNKFPTVITQIADLERSHNTRIETLERAGKSARTFWAWLFEPVKIVGVVVLTLAASALYTYFSERLHFDAKAHAATHQVGP